VPGTEASVVIPERRSLDPGPKDLRNARPHRGFYTRGSGGRAGAGFPRL